MWLSYFHCRLLPSLPRPRPQPDRLPAVCSAAPSQLLLLLHGFGHTDYTSTGPGRLGDAAGYMLAYRYAALYYICYTIYDILYMTYYI